MTKPSGWLNSFVPFVISALILFASDSGHAAKKPVSPKLFNTIEFPKKDLSSFKLWTEMLERVKKGKTLQVAVPNWQELIDSLKGKNGFDLIKAVNAFVNKIDYEVDPTVWRQDDYWATPEQFYEKSGDCEDFAITKFMILKDLGVKSDNMRVVVVKDLNVKTYHAVLALYTDDGHIIILDNQVNDVMLSTRIHHYKPIYSINEKRWWRHL